MIRRATPRDLASVATLLSEAGLPTADLAESGAIFFLDEREGEIVAVGGLESYDSVALLRSVAVAPGWRKRGVGGTICAVIEEWAAASGVERLFLLTETAEDFFTRRGYVRVPRDEAPPPIRDSREFSVLCPDSASLMARSSMRD